MIRKILARPLVSIRSHSDNNGSVKSIAESCAANTRAPASAFPFLGLFFPPVSWRRSVATSHQSAHHSNINPPIPDALNPNFPQYQLEPIQCEMKWRRATGQWRRAAALLFKLKSIGKELNFPKCFTRAWYGKFRAVEWIGRNRWNVNRNGRNGAIVPGAPPICAFNSWPFLQRRPPPSPPPPSQQKDKEKENLDIKSQKKIYLYIENEIKKKEKKKRRKRKRTLT